MRSHKIRGSGDENGEKSAGSGGPIPLMISPKVHVLAEGKSSICIISFNPLPPKGFPIDE